MTSKARPSKTSPVQNKKDNRRMTNAATPGCSCPRRRSQRLWPKRYIGFALNRVKSEITASSAKGRIEIRLGFGDALLGLAPRQTALWTGLSVRLRTRRLIVGYFLDDHRVAHGYTFDRVPPRFEPE